MATPGIPGFEEISALATKYSPEQLQRMAASGMIDVSMAMRAKFLQQRIASDVAKAQVPQTTVAQDVMAPPQPAIPQGLPAAQQMAAAPTASGLDALPVNEADYAGGGIVAFEDGGEVMRFQNRGVVPSATATPYDREMVGTGEFGDLDAIMASIDTEEAGRKFKEQQAAWESRFVPGAYAEPSKTLSLQERIAAQDKAFRDMLEGRTPIATAPKGERAMDIDAAAAKTPKESVADASKQVKEAKKTVEKAEDYLAKRKRMLKEAGVDEDGDKADREELARLRGEATKDRDQAAAMAMIKAGLGIAGGKSQYALQNIGQGAQAAVTDYAKALRDIKADEKEYAKIERDLNKAADARKRGDVDAALKLEESAADREIRLRGVEAQERQATKPTQFQEMMAAFKADPEGFKKYREALTTSDETVMLNKMRYADAALANNTQYLALSNSKKPEDQAKAKQIKDATYARYGVTFSGAAGVPADISDILSKYK